MIPQAMHVGTVDVPWVENVAYPGTWFRLLQADLSAGLYTMHGRMGAGLAVGTHRHHGAVHMFTLSGSWRYLEHGFLNTAGSYLYEPPGSVHTLEVPATNTEPTETFSVIYGTTEYLDAAGNIVGVSDAAAALRGYLESCEAAGVARPDGIIR